MVKRRRIQNERWPDIAQGREDIVLIRDFELGVIQRNDIVGEAAAEIASELPVAADDQGFKVSHTAFRPLRG